MMTLRPPSPNMHWQHIFCAHSLCMKSVVHATPSRQLTTQKQRCTPPQCTTTAQQGQQASSLYDIPELYEQAFGFRNVEDEVDFLMACAERYLPRPCATALELGCGPAHHCIQLAQRGLQVTALDTSGAMLQRAAQRAERANVTLQPLHDDMRTFTMPAPGTIDLAFCLLGTFCHMLTCADALDTMKRVHSALAPGGLVIIETEHPEALFSGTFMDALGAETRMDAWVATPDEGPLMGWKLQVAWGSEEDVFDPVAQVLERNVHVQLVPNNDEEVGTGNDAPSLAPLPPHIPQSLEEQVPQRMWTYQEMLLLATASGFSVVGAYGALETDVDMNSEDAYRMVVVLQKQQD